MTGLLIGETGGGGELRPFFHALRLGNIAVRYPKQAAEKYDAAAFVLLVSFAVNDFSCKPMRLQVCDGLRWAASWNNQA